MLFIKFNFKGGYMRLDYLKQEYENLRFTIHSPSEHIIDGVGYDLELQFFNQKKPENNLKNKNKNKNKFNKNGNFSVFSIFF